MRVDAHQHFWRLDEPWFDWPPPELTAIHRPFQPADLVPLLGRCGIDKTVLVQVAPSPDETKKLLSIADRHAFVDGVVGWVDLEDGKGEASLREFARHPKFRGVRPMLQSLPAIDWILNPSLETMVRLLVETGLTFDALVRPIHLDALCTFAERHPRLSIIIDHGGKPVVSEEGIHHSGWAGKIAALARLPNVTCKLSGLLTEALPGTPPDAVAPFIDHLLEQFGPGRLMWGSDWPVVELATSYDEWFGIVGRHVAALSDAERDLLLGEVAKRVYSLGRIPGTDREAPHETT